MKTFPHIAKVILFGSRALGTHKKASDVDFAIKGNVEKETLLPYFFDVMIYNDIENKEL